MILKKLRTAGVVCGYVCVAQVGKLLIREERNRRQFLVRNLQRFSGWTLEALGVEVEVPELPMSPNGTLILSNHLSYIDVLVIASSTPAVFVTSVEVANTPILGLLAKSAGSLFVERRKKAWIKEEIKGIAEILREGFNVVVFPEGTTSAGDRVLPFKISLLHSAIEGQADIQPLCLNYVKINQQAMRSEYRDSLFFYGDMEFFPHLRRLLSLESVRVKLDWLERLRVEQQSCRKALAQKAFQSIQGAYLPV